MRRSSPRERAARALSRFKVCKSFLPEVDAVLEAALGLVELERMKRDEMKWQ